MTSVTGIVLCGGRSTRMGRDKALLPFGRETMLQRVVRTVSETTDRVIVVARQDQAISVDEPKGSSLHGCEIVFDPIGDLGPLAGIAHGLRSTATDLNFLVACDLPLLRPAVIHRLIELTDTFDACVPVDGDHVMVLCGIYRKTLADAATTLINTGQRRARALLEHAHTKRVDAAVFRDIDPELESFLSCDTPAAYEEALRRVEERQKAEGRR